MGNQVSVSKKTYDYVFKIDNPYALQTKDGCGFDIADCHLPAITKELSKLNLKTSTVVPPEGYDLFKYSEDWPIVAVLGLFDKGKTWLINSLSGCELASGYLHHTEGLSFKLSAQQTRAIFIDTAGCHSPVNESFFLDKKMANIPDAIALKKLSENFQRELVLRMCDIVFFVVGELTWPDQEYIESSIEKLLKLGKQSDIVIIHNFKSSRTRSEAEKKSEFYIKNIFKVKLEPGDFYSELRKVPSGKQKGKQIQIRHYYLMNHNDDPMWNKRVFESLRQFILSRSSQIDEGKKIVKRLVDTVNACLNAFSLDAETKVELHCKPDNQKHVFYFKTNKEFFDSKRLKTVQFSYAYNFDSSIFEPKYDIALIDDGSKLYRIMVDIPGEYTIQTQVISSQIVLRGEKFLSYQEGEAQPIRYTGAFVQTRESGKFELRIELLPGFEKVTIANVKRSRKNGYFELIVEKPDNDQYVED